MVSARAHQGANIRSDLRWPRRPCFQLSMPQRMLRHPATALAGISPGPLHPSAGSLLQLLASCPLHPSLSPAEPMGVMPLLSRAGIITEGAARL